MDFLLINSFTVFQFVLVTDAAREWANEHIPNHAMLGNSFVVEHRYVDGVVSGILGDGLTLE